MVVKYMHHGDDLVEHRTREASFGAQCTNYSANSMCTLNNFDNSKILKFSRVPPSGNKKIAKNNEKLLINFRKRFLIGYG